MDVRTFEGPTVAAAMQAVREALGEDAIIVATKNAPGGACRIVAAGDLRAPAPAPAPVPVAPEPHRTAAGVSFAGRLKPAPWLAPKQAPDSGQQARADLVLRALESHRVPEGLRQRLHRAALDAGGDLAHALDKLFRFEALGDLAGRRAVVLAGPPGSGKTAMAARLAAQRVLAGGTARLITADTLTTGGADRLRGLARALGVPVETADNAAQLRRLLDTHRDDALTIVDTPATNACAVPDLGALAGLIGAGETTAALVLPVGLDALDAAEAARLFAEIGCTHLVATRLDASRRLGAALVAADAGQLAFAEASCAPTVAGGLLRLDARALVARLIGAAAPATG